MQLRTLYLLCFSTLLALSACSSEQPPFETKYTSPNDVALTYQGKIYHLNRFQKTDGLPFQYNFENDGDLDLILNGKEYDIDSPYDKDKKKRLAKLQ